VFVTKENHRVNHCNVKRARSYTSHKRNATWSWQDKILVPRTRTSYAERRTHGCGYLKWIAHTWEDRAQSNFEKYVELREPENAICHVFGEYCTEALAVSWCESHHHTTSENGQYLGLFQMGDYARQLYGHSRSALGQSVAAYHYFVASGKDWSPWSCKP
jgi:hypothetical protein